MFDITTAVDKIWIAKLKFGPNYFQICWETVRYRTLFFKSLKDKSDKIWKQFRCLSKMPLNKRFLVRPLTQTDAGTISAFMRSQSIDYMRFFTAFNSDESVIAEMLAMCKIDVYSGVFWQDNLVGIFMLRGWDAGFEIPSFGVLIDQKYRGGAFMRLTLDIAKLICKLSGAKQLMAKIHPDNVSPRGARRLGLHQTGVEESTGNIIYHLEL